MRTIKVKSADGGKNTAVLLISLYDYSSRGVVEILALTYN